MDKITKLESCPFCGSERVYRSYVTSKNRYRITCIDCGIMTPLFLSIEDATRIWNARAAKRNVGAKDINGKEICIGDKVKMHYFFENHDTITLGAYEDENEIIGIVGADFWGTYTETEDGRLYYWHDYLEDVEEEIEVIGR